jgi:DNA-binding transcriptional ArsR family regulator
MISFCVTGLLAQARRDPGLTFDEHRIQAGRPMTQDPYQHPTLDEITLPEVLHALSDPLRLSILQALTPGRETAWGSLSVSVAPSTLSHHLKVLRNAGLIINRRDGTRCQISLRPELAERFPGLLDTVLRLLPA